MVIRMNSAQDRIRKALYASNSAFFNQESIYFKNPNFFGLRNFVDNGLFYEQDPTTEMLHANRYTQWPSYDREEQWTTSNELDTLNDLERNKHLKY